MTLKNEINEELLVIIDELIKLKKNTNQNSDDITEIINYINKIKQISLFFRQIRIYFKKMLLAFWLVVTILYLILWVGYIGNYMAYNIEKYKVHVKNNNLIK